MVRHRRVRSYGRRPGRSAAARPSGGPVTLIGSSRTSPAGRSRRSRKRCTDRVDRALQGRRPAPACDRHDQREQLVRRLAAKDSTVDIVGMDVIWTAEFANAGWIKQWPTSLAQQVTNNVFPSVVKTASFEGKLYGAPFNSNTELLWYRKDLVDSPEDLGPDDQRGREARVPGKAGHDPGPGQQVRGLHRLGQRADRSAGGQILSARDGRPFRERPTERRWR